MFNHKTKSLLVKYATDGMTIAELEYLGLSTRIISMLENSLNLLYLKDLLNLNQKDILTIRQFDKRTLRLILESLNKIEDYEKIKAKWNSSSQKIEIYKNKVERML